MTDFVALALFGGGAILVLVVRSMLAPRPESFSEGPETLSQGVCRHCGEPIHHSSYGLFVHSNGMYSCYHCKTVAEL